MDNEDNIKNCPHCGTKLSPWQKVLLKVDRAIMCKNCWYRIILETKPINKAKEKGQERKDGNKEKK